MGQKALSKARRSATGLLLSLLGLVLMTGGCRTATGEDAVSVGNPPVREQESEQERSAAPATPEKSTEATARQSADAGKLPRVTSLPADTTPDWQMRVAGDGTLTLEHKGVPVGNFVYRFWGANWAWAGAEVRTGRGDGGATSFTGVVPNLNLAWKGDISSSAPHTLTFRYNLDAATASNGIIGGGMEWSLSPESPVFVGKAAEATLLPDNRGFRWQVGQGQGITVRFREPTARVYFERGNPRQIRTFLVGENLAAGKKTVEFTVELPKGGRVAKSLTERYGPENTANWYRDALQHDVFPVDLSGLNEKPAGKRGFVQAKGEGLVFADGTPARFWGGNLAAYALFDSKENIQQQAKRIARMGFNLMRLHHHDSTRWVSPTVIDKNRNDSRSLDAQGMDRIDWWIKCLKDEGVYVWLDLHVGRQFKPGDAIQPGYEEVARQEGEGKGFCYVNPTLKDRMKEFNAAYLNHVNPYTRLAYKDDPAIMGLLLTNENDVTHHFGNMLLPDKNNSVHNGLFHEKARAFAAKTGLPWEQVTRTWEAGPSKLFLNSLEQEFNADLLRHLDSLGVKVPVSTTNYWGAEGLYSLPSLSDGGIVDAHSYGASEAISTNPRFEANYIAWIGAAQIYGKPLSITEWNTEYPATDRFCTPLYLASIACLQGWDAPMIYNYSQRPFDRPDRADTWSTFYDPALSGMMPAAAVAFRQGHISPAREEYCLTLSREQLYLQDLSPATAAAIRTLMEQHKFSVGLPTVKELPGIQGSKPAAGVKTVSDPKQDFIPPGQTFTLSDTGELWRDWNKGVATVNTPETQSASGWIGGREIALGDVKIQAQTPKAAIAVTSLDNQPLRSSQKVLVSALARVVASPGGRTPYLSEPVSARIQITSDTGGLRCIPLAADGTRLPEIPLKQEGKNLILSLPAPRGTHWFLLTKM